MDVAIAGLRVRRNFRDRDIRERVLKTHSEIDQVSYLHSAFDRFPLKLVRVHHDARLLLALDNLVVKLKRFWRARRNYPILA